MKIITYVPAGAITHYGALGNRGRTEAGDVQATSAGTGIFHADYNLEDEATHSFQLSILPDRPGGAPRWDTVRFPKGERARRTKPRCRSTPMPACWAPRSRPAIPCATLDAARKGYLVAASGAVEVGGVRLAEPDGAAIADEETRAVTALADSEPVRARIFGELDGLPSLADNAMTARSPADFPLISERTCKCAERMEDLCRRYLADAHHHTPEDRRQVLALTSNYGRIVRGIRRLSALLQERPVLSD